MTTELPPVARPTNIMAVIALVAAFVLPVVGIVLGVLARNQIRHSGENGAALAAAGVILGIVFSVLWVLGVGIVILVAVATGQILGNFGDLWCGSPSFG